MPGKLKIQFLAKHYFEKARSIRRHIHMHPELSFQEYNTSFFIQEQLTQAGINFKSGFVKTGIVATIEGKNPEKKTILLRADMDALSIEEKNEVSYKSSNIGIMHACGHDVHSACMLGAAFILNDLKKEWEGTVKIMFQPGEEMLPGGAKLMIEAGVLENPKVDKAFALHVFPSMQSGSVGFKTGMYMASTDELYIKVNGKGGHAAMPNEYVNPLLIASEILLEINKKFMLEGKSKNPYPTVVAFGKMEGKGATNVIPSTVEIAGTMRTMNETWRKQIKEELRKIIQEYSNKYKTQSELKIVEGYPALINDEVLTNQSKEFAEEYLGKKNVSELPLRMTAEDFSFIAQRVPSCFFRLGTSGADNKFTAGVHNSHFDIDESALETGMGMMAWLAVKG